MSPTTSVPADEPTTTPPAAETEDPQQHPVDVEKQKEAAKDRAESGGYQ